MGLALTGFDVHLVGDDLDDATGVSPRRAARREDAAFVFG